MASKTNQKFNPSLLIIDDEKDVIYSFRRVLAGAAYEFLSAQSGPEGVKLFREKKPALVIMDIRMPGMDGLQALREIRKADPKALVIIMTAFSSSQAAIEAMKAGAFDYITKPFDIEKLKHLIHGAMRSAESMKEVVSYQPLLSREEHAQGIIGKSEAMQSVYKEIGRVAAKNITVLISGETGTGKELVARALYHHGERSEKRFIPVSCGAIPEPLLESELFGHERGAFTGAHARRIGKFEICNGGTIFLDEIGELTPATQAKLLRSVQEREIERVGGGEAIAVDVRLIAATHRDLREMIARGKFREDLFYRLNVANIHLPPLRDRKSDIPLLTEYFVERFQTEYGSAVTVSKEAIRRLQDYDWPGNVRELENAIKNSLVRVKGQVLLAGDLKLGGTGSGSAPSMSPFVPARAPEESGSIPELDSLMQLVFEQACRMRAAGEREDAFDLVEKCLVRDALERTEGNQVRASKLLGVTRSTLRKRMAKYGIRIETKIHARGGS